VQVQSRSLLGMRRFDDVRFALESGRIADIPGGPSRANSDVLAMRNK
jgi:hypothetical protein